MASRRQILQYPKALSLPRTSHEANAK